MELVYREIKPGRKYLKRAYLAVMLWFMGRAVQAASRVDRAIMKEVRELPNGIRMALGVRKRGPYMVLGKDGQTSLRYLGSRIADDDIDLKLAFKYVESGFMTFTLQENTASAAAYDRLTVEGELAYLCALVRILDRVQVYLLPKPLAKLAVKRYPHWPLLRMWSNRIRIYWRTLLGY